MPLVLTLCLLAKSCGATPQVLDQLGAALAELPFLKVASISVGRAPPVILGLKHYPQTAHGHNIILDLYVLSASDASVSLHVGCGKYVSTTLRLYVFSLFSLKFIERCRQPNE